MKQDVTIQKGVNEYTLTIEDGQKVNEITIPGLTSPERIAKGLYWDRAWSLVGGCSYVSPGCDNCWAATEAHMRAAQKNKKIKDMYEGLTDAGKWTGKIRRREKKLDLPQRVQKPTIWAVWNDLFHEDVPNDFIYRALRIMRDCERHTFLVLTNKQWGQWAPVDEVEHGFLEDKAHRLLSNIIIGTSGVYYDEKTGLEGWNGTGAHPKMTADKPLWHLRRVGKKTAGRLLDGRTWDEFPEVVTAHAT